MNNFGIVTAPGELTNEDTDICGRERIPSVLHQLHDIVLKFLYLRFEFFESVLQLCSLTTRLND